MLRLRIRLSLANSESERGEVDEARSLLDQVADRLDVAADPGLVGVYHGQRGLMALRGGQLVEARRHLDIAAALLDDEEQGSIVMMNSGLLYLLTIDLHGARHALARTVALATSTGNPLLAAMARHNLGYVAYLAGDLVEALRQLDGARAAIAELAPSGLGVCELDRARVLQAGGLLREADTALSAASESMRANRLDHDLAEVDLTRAEVALLDGRARDALRHARAARRRLVRRGNVTWSRLADLLVLRATLATGRVPPAAPGAARVVAAALESAGLREDARTAALVAVRAQARRGAPVAGPALRRGERIGVRLLARLARAEAALTRGEPAAADVELRAGLDELARHRSRFGSLDLASASALHGHQLARLGLSRAVSSGGPGAVHTWIERTRALSLRLSPARPERDDRDADRLAELRAVRVSLRSAELAGSVDPDLAARRDALERAVRDRSWQQPGSGPARDAPARLSAVRDALGSGALVSYLVVDDRLHALVATRTRARVVELAARADVIATLRRVRADLDAAARSMLPPPVRAVVAGSLVAGLRRLDDQLWRPVSRWTGGGPVLVVPTGELAAVPWTMLPGLRGRAITVAPAATWWLRHRRSQPPGGRVVVAAGPGLRRAEEEATVVAEQWPGAVTMTGPDATAGAVLDAAVGAGVLHLAAHGRHEPDNPLFSSVELADGPLFGYDLPRDDRLPEHVVLSACDLGLVVERPGDESLGMTSALLHGGVTSVVAGVARVNDDTACQLMIAYHAALRSGLMPSEALAVATAGSDEPDHPAPFVVVGAGW